MSFLAILVVKELAQRNSCGAKKCWKRPRFENERSEEKHSGQALLDLCSAGEGRR